MPASSGQQVVANNAGRAGYGGGAVAVVDSGQGRVVATAGSSGKDDNAAVGLIDSNGPGTQGRVVATPGLHGKDANDVAGLDQGVINDPGFTAGQHLKVDQR